MKKKRNNLKNIIIITGGAGFLGSHVAEKLVKLNHKIVILDNFSTGRKKNINMAIIIRV